jgi:hypothetical protein
MCLGNGSTSSIAGLLGKLGGDSAPGGAGFVDGAVDEFVNYLTTPDGKFDSEYYIPAKATPSGEVVSIGLLRITERLLTIQINYLKEQ